MLTPGKRYLLLLLPAILMAGFLPLQYSCEMTDHPDATACTSGADSPDNSSHCDSGCTDCGLPCCVGTAMILAAAPALIAVSPIQVSHQPDGLVHPQVEPAPLGHPPRT